MYMIIIFLVIMIMMILVVLMMMIINCGLKCYYDQSLVALFSSALASLCELSKDGYSTALGGLFPLSHNFFQANLLLLTQLITTLSYQSLTKRKIFQKKKFVSWQQFKGKGNALPVFCKKLNGARGHSVIHGGKWEFQNSNPFCVILFMYLFIYCHCLIILKVCYLFTFI